MANLLYLVHRLPFPPNKGDKVRSYHLLKHLSAGHRVFLGTFVDDPQDEAYVETVRKMCPDLHVARLHPRLAKLRSLSALMTRDPLSLRYYQDAGLQAWVNQTLAQHAIDATVVFSSVMAQYVQVIPGVSRPPMLVDFVDVDSAKWTQYAASHRWPLSWLYQREGARLREFERAVAARSEKSFFVTESEVALFQKMAPECVDSVVALSNGVDTDYFSPDAARPSPFAGRSEQEAQIPVVFTGAMDYWPNVDAVTWFARDIVPLLRRSWPTVRFHIVGRNPPPSVLALASESVVVTGTVPDVRPYLQHAAVVVAPLRVARGLQNKILEAMAMGRPVVASHTCGQAINARSGELVCASGVNGFVRALDALLKEPARAVAMGQSARLRVLQSYSWGAHLGGIDRYLNAGQPEREML
ncbi:MAG: TIGR03087 family PEP-CTERM/XrtA system glycosyltransferase [Gammaproteobacteria bacterium]|uniref:TIGR03087 family PEP-CTERM/XrtA system glycosyltransferase n=1 Tax=Rhodoferax sp. TaxID=50421 RepID=UPI00184E480F|nr:TIGR03087 family PEP-CTERM/XrtA system glycosyltransferase [Rhodoferax sp.]MBU3897483.1 TIGR03087 family PEP-CTERM/XrtA system glycosyltransferase [Gammaproteobacteria bacterium]MBA3058111.1 TIGR03087 family PEP-CTERM/XrtA system glycosyltransferase [Rhodoferax sp.]MBU3996205.1 TIGR03087 family PEP-CTERM/XrtA system glycosyltransferase [Gammaproteobacteria bacterium]MBU4018829.1 TIGR03087 family PEP-CTERM/XrtA system glycosyltransferase [Gammaproteobacteria bacterium]MBU4079784.1 TIGR03087 